MVISKSLFHINIVNIYLVTEGEICRVAGWGETIKNNKCSGKEALKTIDFLIATDVSIWNLEKCKESSKFILSISVILYILQNYESF